MYNIVHFEIHHKNGKNQFAHCNNQIHVICTIIIDYQGIVKTI